MYKNSLLWRHGAPIKSGISGLCANDKKGRKIITTLSQINEKDDHHLDKKRHGAPIKRGISGQREDRGLSSA